MVMSVDYAKEYNKIYYAKTKERTKERVALWRRENPEKYKEHKKNNYLKTMYGLSLTEYNLLFTKQQGCCYICRRHQSELTVTLCVDHCHKTGKVRSLLCLVYNTDVGRYENRKEEIEEYLKDIGEQGVGLEG